MKYTSTIVVLLLGQSIPTAQSLGVDYRSLITSAESFQKRALQEEEQCFDNLSLLDPGYAERVDALSASCEDSRTTQGSVISVVQDASLCDASAIKNYTDYCDANYQSFVWPDHNITCTVPAPTGYPQYSFTYLIEYKDSPGCYSLACDVDFENETEALAFHVDFVSEKTGSVCTLNDESSVDGPSEPLDSDLQCVVDTETTVGLFSADPVYDEKMKAVHEYSLTESGPLFGPDGGVTILDQYDYSMSDADLVDDLQEYCNTKYKVGVFPDHRVTCTGIVSSNFPPGYLITFIREYRDYFECYAPSCDLGFENDDEALAFKVAQVTGALAFTFVPQHFTGVCTSELLDNESSDNGKTRKKGKCSKRGKKTSKKDKKASKKDKKASKNGKKGE